MSVAYRRMNRLTFLAGAAIALLTAVAAVPGYVAAQPPAQGAGGGGGGMGGGGRMAGLFEGITLSAAQQKTVDSIRTSYQPQMQQLRSQGASARPQMREMMQKQTTAFRAVLTPDQQPVFDKNLETVRSRMQGAGGGAPPSGGGGGDAQ